MHFPVWHKFNAAADQYNQVSLLQQQSAQWLLTQMGAVKTDSVWLDAGCGTGVLAKALAEQGARVWAIDQAANMLKFLEDDDRIQTILADITELPLPDEMLDGVVSNFVLHWLGVQILPEILRVIQPGGHAWLAIPVQGSLCEITERYPEFPVYDFPSADDWLAQASSSLVSYQLQRITMPFANLSALLAALRQMGGDQTQRIHQRQTVALWRQWLSDTRPIDLSFNVLLMHLQVPTRVGGLEFLYSSSEQ
jgi:malonyl-ACP O-methyltransferase BioC